MKMLISAFPSRAVAFRKLLRAELRRLCLFLSHMVYVIITRRLNLMTQHGLAYKCGGFGLRGDPMW